MNEWIAIADQLPEGIVMTRIQDTHGIRNQQPLKFSDRLWWFGDGSMYVYYRPTHWRSLTPAEARAIVDSAKAAIDAKQKDLRRIQSEVSA